MNGTDKPNGAEVDSRLSAEDALRISRHHPDYDTRVNAGLHAVKITKCRPDGPEQNLLHDWTLDRTLPEPVRIAAGKKAGAFLLKEMFLRKKTHAYIGYQLELIGDLIDKRGCYRQVHSTRMWDPDRDTPYYIYGSKARTDDPSYSNDITCRTSVHREPVERIRDKGETVSRKSYTKKAGSSKGSANQAGT